MYVRSRLIRSRANSHLASGRRNSRSYPRERIEIGDGILDSGQGKIRLFVASSKRSHRRAFAIVVGRSLAAPGSSCSNILACSPPISLTHQRQTG